MFEFTAPSGEQYVYKELWPQSHFTKKFPGRTLKETASLFLRVQEIYKRYLGDYLVGADIIIAANERGLPRIVLIQERVEGIRLDRIPEKWDGIWGELDEIDNRVLQAVENPALRGLPINLEYFLEFLDHINFKNFIVTPGAGIKLIDF